MASYTSSMKYYCLKNKYISTLKEKSGLESKLLVVN